VTRASPPLRSRMHLPKALTFGWRLPSGCLSQIASSISSGSLMCSSTSTTLPRYFAKWRACCGRVAAFTSCCRCQPWTLYRLVGCGTNWTAKVRHGGHIQVFSADRFDAIASACGLRVVRTRWSYHLLLQVLDLLYFSWLDWRGPVSGSVEDMSASRRGVVGSLMRAAAKVVACLAWGEARLFRTLPGGCGHFTCERTQVNC
jgi:hypothetical protein